MRAKASFVAAGLLLAWSPASSISASRHGASHSTGPNYDSQVTPALLQLFSVGRANFARQAADRFAASLPTPPAGQTFRAELQPIDNQSGGRAYRPPADWDYADGALSLSLDLNTYGGQSGVILRALQTPGRSATEARAKLDAVIFEMYSSEGDLSSNSVVILAALELVRAWIAGEDAPSTEGVLTRRQALDARRSQAEGESGLQAESATASLAQVGRGGQPLATSP